MHLGAGAVEAEEASPRRPHAASEARQTAARACRSGVGRLNIPFGSVLMFEVILTDCLMAKSPDREDADQHCGGKPACKNRGHRRQAAAALRKERVEPLSRYWIGSLLLPGKRTALLGSDPCISGLYPVRRTVC